jgi:hypothetical protein
VLFISHQGIAQYLPDHDEEVAAVLAAVDQLWPSAVDAARSLLVNSR